MIVLTMDDYAMLSGSTQQALDGWVDSHLGVEAHRQCLGFKVDVEANTVTFHLHEVRQGGDIIRADRTVPLLQLPPA